VTGLQKVGGLVRGEFAEHHRQLCDGHGIGTDVRRWPGRQQDRRPGSTPASRPAP
jgi:hypothetical protein